MLVEKHVFVLGCRSLRPEMGIARVATRFVRGPVLPNLGRGLEMHRFTYSSAYGMK
jgi:hypothetical protein